MKHNNSAILRITYINSKLQQQKSRTFYENEKHYYTFTDEKLLYDKETNRAILNHHYKTMTLEEIKENINNSDLDLKNFYTKLYNIAYNYENITSEEIYKLIDKKTRNIDILVPENKITYDIFYNMIKINNMITNKLFHIYHNNKNFHTEEIDDIIPKRIMSIYEKRYERFDKWNMVV